MHIAHLHITQINAQLHISGQKEVCKILQDLQKVCKNFQDLQKFLQNALQKFSECSKKMFGIFCYRTITATERRRGAPP